MESKIQFFDFRLHLASQKRDFRVVPPGLHKKLGHFWNPDKILKKMKWCWPWARHFLTHFRPILEYFFRKNSNFDQKNPFLTENFFFKIKFEKLSGVSKNKIWDILGQFGHNLALKKAREKEVYCRIWGSLDHCVIMPIMGKRTTVLRLLFSRES